MEAASFPTYEINGALARIRKPILKRQVVGKRQTNVKALARMLNPSRIKKRFDLEKKAYNSGTAYIRYVHNPIWFTILHVPNKRGRCAILRKNNTDKLAFSSDHDPGE